MYFNPGQCCNQREHFFFCSLLWIRTRNSVSETRCCGFELAPYPLGLDGRGVLGRGWKGYWRNIFLKERENTLMCICASMYERERERMYVCVGVVVCMYVFLYVCVYDCMSVSVCVSCVGVCVCSRVCLCLLEHVRLCSCVYVFSFDFCLTIYPLIYFYVFFFLFLFSLSHFLVDSASSLFLLPGHLCRCCIVILVLLRS